MKFFPLFLQLAVSLGDYWDEGRCLNETESTETVFMQMLKREKVLSTKEYAEAMQCNQQQDSFKLNGGDFVFVLSPSAGVLWGDLMASWQKGPQNQRYIAVDYTFMSKSYQINDYTALSLDAGVTTLPMTLWLQETNMLILPLPFATGCNSFWAAAGGFIVSPWQLVLYQSKGFDEAGWPKSLDPEALIVEDLAWRIRFKPKLMVIPGETPETPPIQILKASFYLEFRPIFRDPGPPKNSSTTLTTTTKPYDSRRRGWRPPPDLVPREVVEWCVANGICCVEQVVVPNPRWTCVRCCPSGNCPSCPCSCHKGQIYLSSNVSNISMSISLRKKPLALREINARGDSEEGHFDRKSLTIPSGVLFDTPELHSLLSTEEMQRVKEFKSSTDSPVVPPEGILVKDAFKCPEPFIIGGGCECLDGCSPAPYIDQRIDGYTRLLCSVKFPAPPDLVTAGKIICAVDRPIVRQKVQGLLSQPEGITATCPDGARVIGGSCNMAAEGNEAFETAFPVDERSFYCSGVGEMAAKPVKVATATAYCLEPQGNEDVKIIKVQGRANASAKCPESYQLVGGGCNFLDGYSFSLRQSYPTQQNTWECKFETTFKCGPSSPDCLLSEARAVCMAVLS
ncbi:unnamed protein product [Durusdinium trenchii]|uniref:Uncharacterized protein n=1 Tax=Durusdinium trenchii TaxID=1381693 RepID=A0ABP0Q4H4_9DINO